MSAKRAGIQSCIHDADIGARTKVWQFASVIRGAKLGEDCVVGSCAIVDAATIGDRCHIGHGAQVHPGSVLGDDVFVGPGAVICNDAWPRVHKRGFEAPGVAVICDHASIGANAVVLPGLTVGVGAMVAAGAVVTRSVPARHRYLASGQVEPITDEEAKCASRVRSAGKAR
jgi:acetyltransferase-like isoleucine patch superfamily enzyme